MKQALLYVRSAGRQCFGIQRQQSSCEAYAAENGFNVAHIICEHGMAGRIDAYRSGLETLLGLARAHEFDTLIMYSFDRISRNANEVFPYLDLIAECGIDILSVHDGSYAKCRAECAEFAHQFLAVATQGRACDQ